MMIAHAIVMDNWSVTLLLRELGHLYVAHSLQRQAALPPVSIQVADFARWQHEWIAGPRSASLLQYWLDALPGPIEPTHLPTRQEYATASERGGIHMLELPPALSQRIREYGSQHGLTPFMITLAAFKLLLHRYTERSTVTIGVGVIARDRVEIEALIGCFMNILLFRTDFSGQPTFAEALSRVRDTTLGAFAHQAMPWIELLRVLRREGRLTLDAPVRIMADHLTIAPEAQQVGDVTVMPMAPERQEHATGSDMTFRLQERADSMAAILFYKTDLFTAADIEQLLQDFVALLSNGLEHPSRPVALLARG